MFFTVDLFAAYDNSRRICLLYFNFFITVFNLKNNKKFQRANVTAIVACCN